MLEPALHFQFLEFSGLVKRPVDVIEMTFIAHCLAPLLRYGRDGGRSRRPVITPFD